MSTLKEDLAELSDTLPVVRDEAAKATGHAHALAEAAAALLQDVTEARDEASTLLTQVRDAMPALKVEIETLEKGLDAAGAAAQQAWTHAQEALGTAEQALHTAAGRIVPLPGEVENALSRAGGRLDQAAADGADHLQRLTSTAHDGSSRLHAAAAVAMAEAASLHEQVAHAQEEVHAAERALFERMQQLATTLQQDATGLLEKLSQRHQELDANVNAPLDALGPAVSEIEDGWETHLHDAATAPLVLSTDAMRTALEDLARDAEQHETVIREHQKVQESSLGALEQTAGRLPDGMRQIKAALDQLRQQ